MNGLPAGGFSIRQADWPDAISIQRLLNNHSLVHRYLDWRDPLQWLGPQPYLLLEKDRKVYSALACPPDPENVAWVRLFACSWEIDFEQAWDLLLPAAIHHLSQEVSHPCAYILALEDWIDQLMQHKQYPKHQELVILQKDLIQGTHRIDSTGITMRNMTVADLHNVQQIDAACFEDLWVYSLPTLQLAFQQSRIAYLVETRGKPIAYLLATISGRQAHLARIAVLGEFTRQHIATSLIEKLFSALDTLGIRQLTLNTQSNNPASLALYDKMGFRRTGETFAVYEIS